MQTQTSTPRSAIGPRTWTVPSSEFHTTGVMYRVVADAVDGRLTCTCEASKYPKTAGKCWHLKAVISGALGKPKVRYQPAPAPRLAADDLYADAVVSGPLLVPAL